MKKSSDQQVRILKDAGFASDEIRILIENGICGKIEAEVLDVNKDGVFDSKDVEAMRDKRTVKFDRSKMDAINNEIVSISNIEERNKKDPKLLTPLFRLCEFHSIKIKNRSIRAICD
jgi:hypothetical protein